MSYFFKTLKAHNQPYIRVLALFLLLTLVVSVTSVIMTVISGDMSQAALHFETSEILRLLVVLSGVMLIRAMSSAVSALLLGRFTARVGYRFRDNFARVFLQKPFAALEGKNSGESLSVFTADLNSAVDLVSSGGLRMIGDILGLLVVFGYMLYVNWWLTLIFFAMFPVLTAMQVLISVPIQKKTAERMEAAAKLTAVVNDSLQNISIITAYSLEEVIMERCRNANITVIAAVKSYARSALSLLLAGILASQAPVFVIVIVLSQRVIGGYMNIAEFIVFIGLAGEAGGWLSMLSQRQNQVQTGAGGAKRLAEHLAGEPEQLESGNAIVPTGEYAVEATGLRFAYGTEEDAPLVLDDVTFRIKKGSRVAFVGGSGSGKSTVIKLLLGLYAPKEGSISVMGESEASLASLREVFAYVPQDSFLFPESIGENITGESGISDSERLIKACRDAGIMDFIESLPNRFDSVLNESAENISGGQKQRIALARAFYKDAPIILFDEATSALDPATEAEIFKSFDSLARDKTVIMVAHRVKAISFCDTIVVMDGGRVEAIGTHEELLEKSPSYAKLSKEAGL